GIELDRYAIPRWYFLTIKAHYDLSQPWLWVEPDERFRGRLVVNRTSRYRNPLFKDYNFLNQYRPVFLGLPSEFEEFVGGCPNAEFVECGDLLQVARVIAGAKAFIGNQSVAWAIAEGLKTGPRALEICPSTPNIVPTGGMAYDFLYPAGAEWA